MHIADKEDREQAFFHRVEKREMVVGDGGVAVRGEPAGADDGGGVFVIIMAEMDERPGGEAGRGGEESQARPAFEHGNRDAGDGTVPPEGQRQDEAGKDKEDGHRRTAIEQAEAEHEDRVERAVAVRDGADAFMGEAENQVVQNDDGGRDAAQAFKGE